MQNHTRGLHLESGEQDMDLKEFFLKQKQAAHEASLAVLGKIPPERIAWRPQEGMLSLGEIARHIWMSEEGVRRLALANDWSYYERRIPLGLFAIVGQVKSVEEELAQIERVHQATMSEVGVFPLERWEEERVNPKFNMRRKVAVILFGINEHHVHHRAQVGSFLHMLTGLRASHYAL
jgi:uncharacterized damage-inducible protein DinB